MVFSDTVSYYSQDVWSSHGQLHLFLRLLLHAPEELESEHAGSAAGTLYTLHIL